MVPRASGSARPGAIRVRAPRGTADRSASGLAADAGDDVADAGGGVPDRALNGPADAVDGLRRPLADRVDGSAHRAGRLGGSATAEVTETGSAPGTARDSAPATGLGSAGARDSAPASPPAWSRGRRRRGSPHRRSGARPSVIAHRLRRRPSRGPRHPRPRFRPPEPEARWRLASAPVASPVPRLRPEGPADWRHWPPPRRWRPPRGSRPRRRRPSGRPVRANNTAATPNTAVADAVRRCATISRRRRPATRRASGVVRARAARRMGPKPPASTLRPSARGRERRLWTGAAGAESSPADRSMRRAIAVLDAIAVGAVAVARRWCTAHSPSARAGWAQRVPRRVVAVQRPGSGASVSSPARRSSIGNRQADRLEASARPSLRSATRPRRQPAGRPFQLGCHSAEA